ncbi:MAG: hypothetical protein Kow0029_28080 [Candidatus Rifleibacteriota bacterium]
MKIFLSLTVLLAIAILSVPMNTLAAEKITEPVPEAKTFQDDNAALRYLMVIGFMPDLSREDADQLKDITSLESFDKIPQKVRMKLHEASSYRTEKLLEFAAKCKDCNFMPDQSYKPDDYYPPYRTLRTLARYLNAGGWYQAKIGDHEKAARLFVAVFRFGDDAENYGPLISYMIGYSIREIALESMKTFLAGEFKPEAKKIILDYLKSLPKPAFRVKEGLVWERKSIENILKILDSNEGMIEILKNVEEPTDEHKEVTPSNPEKACCANQRVLMGALEMAAMDGIIFPDNASTDDILNRLVKDHYLRKTVECPRNGKYKIKFHENDNYTEVSCSCGADPDKPLTKEETFPRKDNAAQKNKLASKAEEYRNSGKFARDRKEIFEYYDKMINLDQFKENALEEIQKIQDEYESKENILIKAIGVDFKKIYGKQLKLQEEIESLIK